MLSVALATALSAAPSLALPLTDLGDGLARGPAASVELVPW